MSTPRKIVTFNDLPLTNDEKEKVKETIADHSKLAASFRSKNSDQTKDVLHCHKEYIASKTKIGLSESGANQMLIANGETMTLNQENVEEKWAESIKLIVAGYAGKDLKKYVDDASKLVSCVDAWLTEKSKQGSDDTFLSQRAFFDKSHLKKGSILPHMLALKEEAQAVVAKYQPYLSPEESKKISFEDIQDKQDLHIRIK